MSSDADPDVSALAINVVIPEELRWTDTRRGEEFTLMTAPSAAHPCRSGAGCPAGYRTTLHNVHYQTSWAALSAPRRDIPRKAVRHVGLDGADMSHDQGVGTHVEVSSAFGTAQ
ncbi:MAG: hypothetical protein FWJ93_02345 [Micromonosporaceae bacterium]